jgi:hypothetical protein
MPCPAHNVVVFHLLNRPRNTGDGYVTWLASPALVIAFTYSLSRSAPPPWLVVRVSFHGCEPTPRDLSVPASLVPLLLQFEHFQCPLGEGPARPLPRSAMADGICPISWGVPSRHGCVERVAGLWLIACVRKPSGMAGAQYGRRSHATSLLTVQNVEHSRRFNWD